MVSEARWFTVGITIWESAVRYGCLHRCDVCEVELEESKIYEEVCVCGCVFRRLTFWDIFPGHAVVRLLLFLGINSVLHFHHKLVWKTG